MDKTNINALVQSIERSLHLIYKNLFSIKQYQFPPKLAWIYLKNHAVLRHCVFVDGCGYTFTLDGQKSWWGATGSGGRTAKCAANEDETWLWPWQYHVYLSNTCRCIFLGTCYSNECCVGFFIDFLARAREKMDPDKSVVFAYDGVPAHLDLPYASPPRHRWKGFKLSKATPMTIPWVRKLKDVHV